MRALRSFFDGTGPYSAFALASFLLGFAMLLSILLSPHGWQWWLDAHQIRGHELDGVVSYTYEGQNWSIDDAPTATRTGPRTVYVIATAPDEGSLVNTPTVILDWAITVGPGLVGVTLLGLGFVRRSQRHKRRVTVEAGPVRSGTGIPSDLIRTIVRERDNHGHAARLHGHHAGTDTAETYET